MNMFLAKLEYVFSLALGSTHGTLEFSKNKKITETSFEFSLRNRVLQTVSPSSVRFEGSFGVFWPMADAGQGRRGGDHPILRGRDDAVGTGRERG